MKAALWAVLAFVVLSTHLLFAMPQDSKKGDTSLDAAKKAYEQEIRKVQEVLQAAKKKGEEDTSKAREKLIKAYEEAIKRTTQKGDLEAANKLLAEKKALEAGVDFTTPNTEGKPEEAFDARFSGLVGIVESKSGDTHLLVQFNTKIDLSFWKTKVVPKLNGLYTGEPTLKVAGFIVCKTDLTLTFERSEPNACFPSKVLVDDKTVTAGAIPLSRGVHKVFVDFGRHNADGEPGTLAISSKDAPRDFGCFHNKALLSEAAARAPKAEGKKPGPESIISP